MKRYLITSDYDLYTIDEITKDDLVRLKQGKLQLIVDTKEGKYFDVDNNNWKDITVKESQPK